MAACLASVTVWCMTVDDVRERLEEITRVDAAFDAEKHQLQDKLYVDVLAAIAEGAPSAASLAAEALGVQQIDFFRWYG